MDHRLTDTPAIVSTDADEMSTQMAKLFAAAGQKVWRQILADFLAQPYKIALLVLSVPLVLWFILRGGARDKL